MDEAGYAALPAAMREEVEDALWKKLPEEERARLIAGQPAPGPTPAGAEEQAKLAAAQRKLGRKELERLAKERRDDGMPDLRGDAIKNAWADQPLNVRKGMVQRETTARQDALTAQQLLDSFNEQLGDMLKDLEHYADAEPGKAMMQASKYLDRLVDALRLLLRKTGPGNRPVLDGTVQPQAQEEVSRQDRIKSELIAARKGLLLLEQGGTPNPDPKIQAEERLAMACDFMREIGAPSIADLSARYGTLGAKVNASVRRALAA